MRRSLLFAAACVVAAFPVLRVEAQSSWTPPLGIPAPPFGVSEVPGAFTHYVDNTSPAATDTSNPNGSPSQPRLTVPTSLPAGSVVEVHGGLYVLSSDSNWSGAGTPSSPIFIKGVGSPIFRAASGVRTLSVSGSYIIVEGLVLDSLAFRMNGDHNALRGSEVKNYSPTTNGTAVSGTGSNLVIYDNQIHDNGDPANPAELDIHGVKFSTGKSYIWIVDNVIYDNGGDEIQLGNETEPEPWVHHVYIGRNVLHGSRENSVDVKRARDVIISQNDCYDHHAVTSSDGAAIVVHYAPERVWVIFNKIHDAAKGVRFNASGGGGKTYIVGNMLYRIHSPSSPSDAFAVATAIQAWDIGEVHIVNNTIYDANAGIALPDDGVGATVRISNNLVSSLAETTHHVYVSGPFATATLDHTLMKGPGDARIKWSSSTPVYDVTAFRAAFPAQCVGCIQADPRLVDPAALDLHLGPGSPALDTGVTAPVYATFFGLYGIDIKKDFEGRPRPLGSAFDLGAYEGGQSVAVAFERPTDTVSETAISHSATVVLSTSDGAVTSVPVTVLFATSNGTAQAGSDYAATSGTLSFPAGTASGSTDQVAVTITDDASGEGDETFKMTLSSASGGSLGTQTTHTVTILESDLGGSLKFSATGYTVAETGPAATITVSRSGSTASAVTVDFATSTGTATAASDYTATSGTLSFAAGVLTRTFNVPITNDTLDEPNETVILTLSNPTGGGALVAPSTATLTITDNDVAGTIKFSATTYSKSENGGSATITVTRSSSTASNVTVNFATRNGTATAGSDYTATSGTLTFNAGELSKTFSVPILDDTIGDGNETVALTLSNPTGGATLTTPSSATLTITENEAVLQFSTANYAVVEGAATATITVTRLNNLSGAVTVNYSVAEGTATNVTDFTATTGILTFATTVASKTFTVPITNDINAEPTETVNLVLSNPTGGAALGSRVSAVLNITDNDPFFKFSVASYTGVEGTAAATVTVTRTSSAGAVTVDFATSDGTAVAGSDYATTTGTLSFAAGILSRTFTVPIINDTTAESLEQLNLTLSNPTGGAGLGTPNVAVLKITDNDPLFKFSAAAYAVAETTASATITVARSTSVGAVGVTYATSNGSATAGQDYSARSGVLTFASGVLSKTFTVPIVNDGLGEANETINLTLSNPTGGAALGSPSAAVLTITDNDVRLKFSAASYTVAESGSAVITVSRIGPTTSAVAVSFATSNGTATAGSDYNTTTGTLTFAAGVVSRTFTVGVIGDTIGEGNETINLTLSNPTNLAGLVAPSSAVLTITDNDPYMKLGAATYTVAESGPTVTITVTRAGLTTGTVGVTYSTSDGTALAGTDYTTTSGTLTFLSGQTSKTFTVPIIDDADVDPAETFNVTLSSPTGTGAGLATPNTAVVTITDNE